MRLWWFINNSFFFSKCDNIRFSRRSTVFRFGRITQSVRKQTFHNQTIWTGKFGVSEWVWVYFSGILLTFFFIISCVILLLFCDYFSVILNGEGGQLWVIIINGALKIKLTFVNSVISQKDLQFFLNELMCADYSFFLCLSVWDYRFATLFNHSS